jgi:hypothetical protein
MLSNKYFPHVNEIPISSIIKKAVYNIGKYKYLSFLIKKHLLFISPNSEFKNKIRYKSKFSKVYWLEQRRVMPGKSGIVDFMEIYIA